MLIAVLAPTHVTGMNLIRRAGLGHRARVYGSAGSLRGARVDVILELDTFAGRLDRHALEAALRYMRPAPVHMLVSLDDLPPRPMSDKEFDRIAAEVAEIESAARAQAEELAHTVAPYVEAGYQVTHAPDEVRVKPVPAPKPRKPKAATQPDPEDFFS